MSLASACCGAPVRVGGDDREGTHSYVCLKCGQPCDLKRRGEPQETLSTSSSMTYIPKLKKGDPVRVRPLKEKEWCSGRVALVQPDQIALRLAGAVRAGDGFVTGMLPLLVDHAAHTLTGLSGHEYELEFAGFEETITCPQCHRTSYNLNDIAQKYCGFCHQFHEFMSR